MSVQLIMTNSYAFQDGPRRQEQVIQFLEKSVAIERGMGVKSKSVLTVHEVSTHFKSEFQCSALLCQWQVELI